MKWLVVFIAVFRRTADAFNYDFDDGCIRYMNSYYPNIYDHSRPLLFYPQMTSNEYNQPMNSALNTFRAFPFDYNTNRFVPLSYRSHQIIYPEDALEDALYYTYSSFPNNYYAENEHIVGVGNGFQPNIIDQPYVAGQHYSTYNSYGKNYNADTDNKHIVGIVNGFEADITDRPYQAGLMYRKKLYCGGSIISAKHILTAGHCYISRDVSVLVGTQDSLNKNHKGVVALVKHFTKHPSYEENPPKNDIAIVVLHKELPIDGKRIAKISLPKQDQRLPIGKMGTVSGWGDKSYRSSTNVHTLNAVRVPILDDRECAKSYGNEFSPKLFFCAGYLKGGQDFCNGDSGGPFVIDRILWGIVSYSNNGCADAGYPGVYTNVANYRNWIDGILN